MPAAKVDVVCDHVEPVTPVIALLDDAPRVHPFELAALHAIAWFEVYRAVWPHRIVTEEMMLDVAPCPGGGGSDC